MALATQRAVLPLTDLGTGGTGARRRVIGAIVCHHQQPIAWAQGSLDGRYRRLDPARFIMRRDKNGKGGRWRFGQRGSAQGESAKQAFYGKDRRRSAQNDGQDDD